MTGTIYVLHYSSIDCSSLAVLLATFVCYKSNTKSSSPKQKEEKEKRKLKRDQRKQAEKEKSHMQTVAGMARFAARQIAIFSGHSQRTGSDGQPSIGVEKKKRSKRTAQKKKAEKEE